MNTRLYTSKSVSNVKSFRKGNTRGKARGRKNFGYLLKVLRKDDKR